MRKLYSFIAFALMMVVPLAANAWSYDLPEDNEVLQSETYNMRLFKSWNFIDLTVNGVAINPATFTTGDASSDLQKTDGYAPVKVTNDGMDGWYMGIGNIEFNTDKGGLYNNKNGIRYLVFDGLKAGQIVCIQSGGSNVVTEPNIETNTHVFAANCIRCQKASTDGTIAAWTCSYLSNNGAEDVVEEITDSIHAIQNQGAEYDADGNVISGGADSFRYFKVLIDGALYMAMGKYASIQGFQIWIDAAADESVSVPSYKMFSVDGESRNIELVSGESTLGAACHVTYGIMEEEGATNEDYEYDPEVGYFSVQSSDDADGDGYVTVEAITISENGVKSDPVDFKIAVGEITLNAPTLTLYGFAGEERIYSIGWTNNTLCGEDYTIVVDADGGNKHFEYEPNSGVGETISFSSEATVTVSVNGYNDGICTTTAENQGISVNRKNAEKSEAGAHDWDFVNLSNYQKALIKQDPELDPSIIVNCYIVKTDGEVSDTTYYSAEEYAAGVAADGVTDLSSAVPVLKASGWYEFDTSKNRTSRLVVEGGEDLNSDGYGYAEDAAKLWDGLEVSNPPYLNSSNVEVSSILLYINDDLGLYMGTKPTFTFPREAAAAGEYVLMYIGYGGSNYTNSRYPVIYQVPTGELLSVTLGNNPHVFYIDVYTYENLPEDEYATSVKSVNSKGGLQPIVGYYSTNGAKLTAPTKGINIVKYADGTTMKVLIK